MSLNIYFYLFKRNGDSKGWGVINDPWWMATFISHPGFNTEATYDVVTVKIRWEGPGEIEKKEVTFRVPYSLAYKTDVALVNYRYNKWTA